MSEVFIDKKVIAPQIAEIFKHVGQEVAEAGYIHMVLLPGSNAWVEDHGRLGVLGGDEHGVINLETLSDHFVAARVGVAEFYQREGNSYTIGGPSSSLVAFKVAAERDSLIKKLFEIPFYDVLRQTVIRAEWSEGKINVVPNSI